MPYIEPNMRGLVDPTINILVVGIKDGTYLGTKRDGVLNYIISSLIAKLYKTSYTELNAAIGMLECAKLELYRRRLAAYEDKKIAENGDVYDNSSS
ncbi:hypothetical protein LCGC14_2751230 [marine sediment metagenome]|uniref:Uncharacterized protein n=1 Tax=marine sediment metagenome TaxID=412755 RepID=A0A0F8Z1U7_9ZZZZ